MKDFGGASTSFTESLASLPFTSPSQERGLAPTGGLSFSPSTPDLGQPHQKQATQLTLVKNINWLSQQLPHKRILSGPSSPLLPMELPEFGASGVGSYPKERTEGSPLSQGYWLGVETLFLSLSLCKERESTLEALCCPSIEAPSTRSGRGWILFHQGPQKRCPALRGTAEGARCLVLTRHPHPLPSAVLIQASGVASRTRALKDSLASSQLGRGCSQHRANPKMVCRQQRRSRAVQIQFLVF